MHTQSPHRHSPYRCSPHTPGVGPTTTTTTTTNTRIHRPNSPNLILPPQIPKFNLPVPTPGHQLPKSAALHMHVRDPLVMFAPDADHGHLRAIALVEDADCAVAVTRDDDGAGDSVGGEGG